MGWGCGSGGWEREVLKGGMGGIEGVDDCGRSDCRGVED